MIIASKLASVVECIIKIMLNTFSPIGSVEAQNLTSSGAILLKCIQHTCKLQHSCFILEGSEEQFRDRADSILMVADIQRKEEQVWNDLQSE